MNIKLSGCALALIGMAAISACTPINDSYSRSNRTGSRRASPASSASEPSLNGNRPASQNPPLAQKSMADLESEELSIRNNASLSSAERQLQLHRVWKEQRDLVNPPTSPASTAKATPEQEHANNGSTANPAPNPTQGGTSTPSSPAEIQKNQATGDATTSAPNPTPAPRSDEPKYATKVPGKNGWIKSPYDGKILDAAGIPPGTQVKDPDSGKIMLVP